MGNTTYTLPEALLQGIVSALGTMPAASVRGLLNAIEGECQAQEQERKEAEIKRIKAQAVVESMGEP